MPAIIATRPTTKAKRTVLHVSILAWQARFSLSVASGPGFFKSAATDHLIASFSSRMLEKKNVEMLWTRFIGSEHVSRSSFHFQPHDNHIGNPKDRIDKSVDDVEDLVVIPSAGF